MRKHFVSIPLMLLAILLASFLWASSAASTLPAPQTFRGEITDSICAERGSHDEMMAKMQSMGREKKTCTMKCAELGAKYVLYDQDNKAVYTLDDQEKAKQFAGRNVQVSGALHQDKLQVTNLQATN